MPLTLCSAGDELQGPQGPWVSYPTSADLLLQHPPTQPRSWCFCPTILPSTMDTPLPQSGPAHNLSCFPPLGGQGVPRGLGLEQEGMGDGGGGR